MRINKYQFVHQMGTMLSQSRDGLDGLGRVCALIVEKARCDAAAIYILNDERTSFSLIAQNGLPPQEYAEGQAFPFKGGVFDLLCKGHQMSFSGEREVKSLYKGAYREVLMIPLVAGGRVMGRIDLLRKRHRPFMESRIMFFGEVFPPLSVFIVNALLAHRKEEKTELLFGGATQKKTEEAGDDRPIRGRALSSGVACGKVILLSSVEDLLRVKRIPSPVNTTLAAIESEKLLLNKALESARRACLKSINDLAQTLSEADVNIFSMHAMMLDDPTLRQSLTKSLEDGHDITTALGLALRSFTAQYSKIEDSYLRERIYDIKDVLLAIKNAADNLRGIDNNVSDLNKILEMKHIVIVARELLPSQLITFPIKKITGIVCEEGGVTSHVAILARALCVPMLVGIPGITKVVFPGESLLLDCHSSGAFGGKCFLRPSLPLVRRFAEPLHVTREQQGLPRKDAVRPVKRTFTKDGTEITFQGNISLVCELPALQHYGVGGVGLYRTEFLFMLRPNLPSEEEQYEMFKQILEGAKGAPVTLRVLDAGGDKPLPYFRRDKEGNPALGLRGMRFLFQYREQILLPHLRALLRASAHGKIRIMFPMIADLPDLLEARKALSEAQRQLRREGKAFDASIPIGVMLEIPSAVRGVEKLLPHVDFLSIGSNDLVQFMFAVDRGNPQVSQWCRKCHPIILQLVRDVCGQVAKFPGKQLSICGEVGSSRRALPLLIGAGLRNFSMMPSRVPLLQKVVPDLDVKECEKLLDEVLEQCVSEDDIQAYLEKKGMLR